MIHQRLRTSCFQPSSSASKMLPSSSSASPASAIIRPGGSSVGISRLQPQIVLRDRGEQRSSPTPEPDRAGREIDDRRRPWCARDRTARRRSARKRSSLSRRLAAEQILDGVEHRAGVRLDRDPVLRPQHVEIERRHHRRDRGARRLVAADLQARRGSGAGGWRCGSSRSTATAPCARARSGSASLSPPVSRSPAASLSTTCGISNSALGDPITPI